MPQRPHVFFEAQPIIGNWYNITGMYELEPTRFKLVKIKRHVVDCGMLKSDDGKIFRTDMLACFIDESGLGFIKTFSIMPVVR